MKTYTLGKHELKLFTSLLPSIPPYLEEQLGDYSKREITVKEADHKIVVTRIRSELTDSSCKARCRRLNGLLELIS